VVWIRWGYPVVQGVKTAASQTIDTAAAAVGAIAPDLTESPKVGDQIGPYRVSSAYGKRVSPCPGCSSDHPGVDIAAPTGSQQFIPDKPSAVVNVECFTYSYRGNTERGAKFTTSYGVAVRSIHLSKCDAGRHRGGQVFALGGTSGTGPHWHIETYRDGAIFPPPASVIWWMVTGTEPKPALSTGGNDAE
jgi:murein DD-endopeptidase MepM/ murein hydrolase activator NlpD